ncbi:hypothetical protein SAMN05216567_121115 [Variovorax sp. OK605]|uniref:hypothetical protein n=1 Tax=Variovorax sp. OK605 TaxID=1855317 RepID=UPI0008E6001F|nr:hypothetical protein [Variovorax sp. OK605]SFQ60464.1 hypothetical protein SAMN05216567_121115 [Variovorax sp. OK605]
MALPPSLCAAIGDLARPASSDLFDVGLSTEQHLHPRFRLLRQCADLAPARCLMCELHSSAFRGVQPEFAASFQSGDFDGALFRLFLFALFGAAGHRVDVGHCDPAFVLSKAGTAASVDAFTVGVPSSCLEPQGDGLRTAQTESHASGVGGSLFRRLQRQPWCLPQAAGRPFVIAIQDFDHLQLEAGAPPEALLRFLFGASGHSQDVDELFPDGFFGQPEAEHVSGIFFCNDATIAKFNRQGLERHAGDAGRMLRHGSCIADDGDASGPSSYVYEVGCRETCGETWNEGTVLIHNPFAVRPLPADWLGASAEMALTGGRLVVRFAHGFHPTSSHTEVLRQDVPAWWVERRTRLLELEGVAHRGT